MLLPLLVSGLPEFCGGCFLAFEVDGMCEPCKHDCMHKAVAAAEAQIDKLHAENLKLAGQVAYERERNANNVSAADLQVGELQKKLAKALNVIDKADDFVCWAAGVEWHDEGEGGYDKFMSIYNLVRDFGDDEPEEPERNWADTHRAGDDDERTTEKRKDGLHSVGCQCPECWEAAR